MKLYRPMVSVVEALSKRNSNFVCDLNVVSDRPCLLDVQDKPICKPLVYERGRQILGRDGCEDWDEVWRIWQLDCRGQDISYGLERWFECYLRARALIFVNWQLYS
jgi:hypothetical protein